MPAPRIRTLPCRAALLLGALPAWTGCTSAYDPEAQFWPNLGPVSFGIGSGGPDAGTRTTPPRLGEDEADEDGSSGIAPSGGSAGATNSSNSARGGSASGGSASGGSSTGGSSATATGGSSSIASSTCSLSV